MKETAGQTSLWVVFGVACIPLIASVVAAILASRSAGKARSAEGEAERIRRLEARVSDKREATYKPLLDLLSTVLSPGQSKKDHSSDIHKVAPAFAGWVSIYGSDDSVRAYRNFMHTTYHKAPAQVMLRAYADFVVAARRDMGDPDTTVGPEDVLAMRLTDFYEGEFHFVATAPFADVAQAYGWEIPWTREPRLPSATDDTAQ
jgi:hypothetical protein